MKVKPFNAILIALLAALTTVCISNAHEKKQSDILMSTSHPLLGYKCVGGESVGWYIDETEHIDIKNLNTLGFYFRSGDPSLTSAMKSAVRSGASSWKGIVNFSESSLGKGEIYTVDWSSTSAVAQYHALVIDPNSGHVLKWEIVINKNTPSSNITQRTLAHEFGHAIGLADLISSKNSGKLMYGTTSGTASAPTACDIWGAKVITGIHSTHSFGYSFYQTDANSANWHKCYCTACGGIKSTGKCTYGTNNRCKLCGVPKGQQTSGIKINPAE